MTLLTEKQVLLIADQALSNAHAAGIAGVHFSKWRTSAMHYVLPEEHEYSGMTIYDFLKKKQSSKAVPEMAKYIQERGNEPWNRGYRYRLEDILNGYAPHYLHKNFKRRLLLSGFLPITCCRCGYEGDPDIDVINWPVFIWYKDNNILNQKLDNIDWLCFNCYSTKKHWDPDHQSWAEYKKIHRIGSYWDAESRTRVIRSELPPDAPIR